MRGTLGTGAAAEVLTMAGCGWGDCTAGCGSTSKNASCAPADVGQTSGRDKTIARFIARNGRKAGALTILRLRATSLLQPKDIEKAPASIARNCELILRAVPATIMIDRAPMRSKELGLNIPHCQQKIYKHQKQDEMKTRIRQSDEIGLEYPLMQIFQARSHQLFLIDRYSDRLPMRTARLPTRALGAAWRLSNGVEQAAGFAHTADS